MSLFCENADGKRITDASSDHLFHSFIVPMSTNYDPSAHFFDSYQTKTYRKANEK